MKIFYSLLICIVANVLFGQAKYAWPIDKVNLTGNYGEVRPNHFHAGIDFSTEGEENLPIYSVADGHVARIKVSPYGYGKVLYVAHTDGKLSVYAHQNRFNERIASFVKAEQIAKESFELEIFPKEGELPVKKGEILGYSGNTGGSTGPHLHFEIRDDLTEVPINPLFYFDIRDTVKPVLEAIAIYDLSDSIRAGHLKTIGVKAKRDSLYLMNDSVVIKNSILGMSFCGDDKEIPKGNPNNIYDVKLFFDSVCVYHHQLNYITFDNARYVNEFSDIINKQKFQKCFVPKNYPFDMYKTLASKGRISLTDTLFHEIRLVLTDESGNSNSLKYWLKTRQYSSYKAIDAKGKFFINSASTYTYAAKGFELEIPSKALFNDAFLAVKNNLDLNNTLTLGPEEAEFRLPASLKIRLTKKLMSDSSRVLLKNGSSYIIPQLKNGVANFSIKNFGVFHLTKDSVRPEIKTRTPVKKLKKIFPKAEHLTFVIKDLHSGIGSYKLYINDKWFLAEYDAKSDLLTCFFDQDTPTGELNVRVEVRDRVGNLSEYKIKLKR
jgi:hypothetical protein